MLYSMILHIHLHHIMQCDEIGELILSDATAFAAAGLSGGWIDGEVGGRG